MRPGEYRLRAEPIELYADRATATVHVVNGGDRPVQVGSHYHFFEANPQLQFDRVTAYGMHLHIPSGSSVRFEPGESKEVELVSFGGHRHLQGFHNWVDGPLDDPEVREQALARMAAAMGRERS